MAWIALGLSIVTVPAAIVVGISNQGNDWFPNLVSSVLVLLPPIVGSLLGIRPARSGNRLGGWANAVGAAWATFIVVFFVGANYFWDGESLLGPTLVGTLLSVAVAGLTESAWQSLRRSSTRTPHIQR